LLSPPGGTGIIIRERPELLTGDVIANNPAELQPQPIRRSPKICGGGFNVDVR
jgi:hypothetical protein